MVEHSLPDNSTSLVLARLVAGTKPTTEAAILRSIVAWVSPDRFAAIIQQCLNEGLVKRTGKRLELTATGKTEALRVLGAARLPGKISWPIVRDKYLVPRVLGATQDESSRKRAASASGLRAVILSHRFELDFKKAPTLVQARDALAWRQLEFLTGRSFGVQEQKFGRGPVARAVLSTLLADSSQQSRSPAVSKILERLAAEAVDAGGTAPAALRTAVLTRWIRGAKQQAGARPFSEEALLEFAQMVRAAASRCKTGWFGQRRVFLSHVWRELQARGESVGLDLGAFKTRLVEANSKGLLTLSRADLVEAMDPADVRESEVGYLGARFHFLRLEEVTP